MQLLSECCPAKGRFLGESVKDESMLSILCYLDVHPITLPPLMLGTEYDFCDNRWLYNVSRNGTIRRLTIRNR